MTQLWVNNSNNLCNVVCDCSYDTHTLSLKQFVIWTDAVSLHQQRACWLINTVFCYCRINCPGHGWAAGDKSQHSHWEQNWRPLFLSLSFCSTTTSQPFVNDCFSAYLFFTVRVCLPCILWWYRGPSGWERSDRTSPRWCWEDRCTVRCWRRSCFPRDYNHRLMKKKGWEEERRVSSTVLTTKL